VVSMILRQAAMKMGVSDPVLEELSQPDRVNLRCVCHLRQCWKANSLSVTK
jgi:hypothetical protein